MNRTTVVTRAASYTGRATGESLGHAGHRVIGVGLRDAAVAADLSTPAGREPMPGKITALPPELPR